MSWIPVSRSSHFSLNNIPFGIISTTSSQNPRPAIAIGDFALDLQQFSEGGGFAQLPSVQNHLSVFASTSLNAFAALGRPLHSEVRKYLQETLSINTKHPHLLQQNADLREKALISLRDINLHLPMDIGDYTDFFAGINHAFKVGSLFRGPSNALQPNYKHLPVGYHGRASSVVISNTPVRRPSGQIILDPKAETPLPTFMPCRRLDIELELGMFVCQPNPLGRPISINDVDAYIFGYVLMNDWSARDIQTWEYVPLGPFNAKNFATTISGWVVLPDALKPAAVDGLPNDIELQHYLKEEGQNHLDIRLEVDLTTKSGSTTTITRTNARNLIWSFQQMLVHHTSSGCPMRTGDLLGSGTISGEDEGSRGSLLEQNEAGRKKIMLADGEERVFLQDGDTITIRGVSGNEEKGLIGFGECVGRIEAAIEMR